MTLTTDEIRLRRVRALDDEMQRDRQRLSEHALERAQTIGDLVRNLGAAEVALRLGVTRAAVYQALDRARAAGGYAPKP